MKQQKQRRKKQIGPEVPAADTPSPMPGGSDPTSAPEQAGDAAGGKAPAFTILDASRYALPTLLVGYPPEAAVLGREGDLKWAGRVARDAIRKGTATQVLIRCDDPLILPERAICHDVRWRDAEYRTAQHRYLCGNWPRCDNPEGPWMFYMPPSKRGNREGPQFCGHCRRRCPTERKRRAMTRLNKARAKNPE